MGKPKTYGEALFELDRPLADFPNRKPWADLEQCERDRFDLRAAGVLDLADKIMSLLWDPTP